MTEERIKQYSGWLLHRGLVSIVSHSNYERDSINLDITSILLSNKIAERKC